MLLFIYLCLSVDNLRTLMASPLIRSGNMCLGWHKW